MRVPTDHLGGDGIDHVAEAEASLFFSHAGVIDDLQQEIAELALEPVKIVPRDRVGDLVGFLDGVWRDGREALLAILRATRLGIAKPRHHAQKIADGVGTGTVLSHGASQPTRGPTLAVRAAFPQQQQWDSRRTPTAPHTLDSHNVYYGKLLLWSNRATEQQRREASRPQRFS